MNMTTITTSGTIDTKGERAMFGNLVRALIYLCFMALAFYLVLWVIGGLGIVLPAMVLHILVVIFVLIAILVLYQLLWPAISGYDWWGRRPPPGPWMVYQTFPLYEWINLGVVVALGFTALALICWGAK
jgi:hypothetical protein